MDKYGITLTSWNRLAKAYHDKFLDLDIYNESYDLFCELIDQKQAHIFEIGCGPGNITRYLLAKRPDFKIMAIDASPNMIKLASENIPLVHFQVMDAREINLLTERFHAIVSGFCIPYLAADDTATLIQNCSTLLEDGGLIYLSAIEGNYSDSRFETGSTGDQAYVYYYDEIFFTNVLSQNGFDLIKIIRVAYPKINGPDQCHLIFIAGKNNRANKIIE